MISPGSEEKRSLFIKKWKARIGQKWVLPSTLEEVFSEENDTVVEVPDWSEEVEQQAINNWAIVNNDPNALWLDKDYACKTKWGGIIAPPLFFFSINLGLPGGASIFFDALEDGVPFDQTLNAGGEWEFFEPMRPGDKITYDVKLNDLYDKEGRRSKILFVVDEAIYTNQKGQIVAVARQTVANTWKSKLNVD